MDTLKEEELKEIESQLSFPNGEAGIEMAKMMNETNIQMNLEAINALDIKNHDHIVEFGHGNCSHLSEILNQASELTYSGLEISETMYAEANKINAHFVNANQADFLLYNGKQIPLKDESSDKIMTVNTLYFWQNPKDFLCELHRILRPNGRLVITFAKQEFMQNLPFVKDKFTLYSNDKAKELVKQTPFTHYSILDKSDVVKSKHGEIVTRKFSVLILDKK